MIDRGWPETRSNFETPAGNPTSKWQGVSITNIRDAIVEANDAVVALRALERYARLTKARVVAEVSELLGIDARVSSFPCTESPTLTCIYDSNHGHAEECVACGNYPPH